MTSSSTFLDYSLLDYLIPSRKIRKEEEVKKRYNKAIHEWELSVKEVENSNNALEKQYEIDLNRWKVSKDEFLAKQDRFNKEIDRRNKAYRCCESPNAVIEYFHHVLTNSEYPHYFAYAFTLHYNQENKMLVVEYSLPKPELMPRLKEVKYIQSKREFKETFISESQSKKIYDDAIYKIVIRAIYELFSADYAYMISSIVLNGWVKSIDRATGREQNPCILTIHSSRGEFMALNLRQVDPKACFKKLKGIACSALHSLTPVAPILQLNKDDARFINPKEIVGELDSRTNLAALDWEDFEHLIRELFEEEFSQNGGEVKITQASRDRGVDAIAFDPDPLRGGKIVIQAKRYTNTVDVAAVRDLYGTVHNEGAIKGILVTTSDYGPDAYAFAANKPLTLLTGSNLLKLLEKHGHRARIDLKEAKMLAIGKQQS